MQCNPQFCVNGFPTFGQFYNCNQFTPYNTIPEVIGEGEIITLSASDGNVQLFFVPTNPYFYNLSKTYPDWNFINKHAWYIRNYPKQVSIPLFTGPLKQRLPETYGLPQYATYDCNMSSSPYKLKFHNDGWSSTTDLHYFTPRTRTWDLCIPQKCNAITQIEIPVATNTYHYQIVCDKPCNCTPKNVKSSEISSCSCDNESQVSPMAVDAKSEDVKCCVQNKNMPKCTPQKNTKSDVRCDCNKEKHPTNNDKLVTTFNEQRSGCVADVGCDIQNYNRKEGSAHRHGIIKLKDVKQEIWQPKTPLSKKDMKSKSSENVTMNRDSNTECSCSEHQY